MGSLARARSPRPELDIPLWRNCVGLQTGNGNELTAMSAFSVIAVMIRYLQGHAL